MKKLLLLIPFLLTGCFTTYDWSSHTRVNQPQTVLAVTSLGDTVQVPINQFGVNYNSQPTYYTDWRFYWRGEWHPPYTYYRYYYVPTPYRYYTPYKTNYNPPKIDSKPRSSGTTTGRSSEKTKSEPRTTGRTQPQKSERQKEPQRKKRGGS